MHKLIDKLHNAINSGIKLELPSAVKLCGFCEGFGKYKQTYNAGCGMESYRASGPCEYCKHSKLFMQGSGFVYKARSMYKYSVPESVINQIYEMNKQAIEVMQQFKDSR